ncbi:hypothetical protein K438DRAFT_2024161 [Mycena galopus ATCC 62051]|nr:hypothetical protein K438DRAFT_2024161 [Mycena galopus ATCC 62051]
MSESVPALPPELERQIFELCALDLPVCIPKLMLVAKHVHEWVEPLLYRTIIMVEYSMGVEGLPFFTDDILSSVFRRKPADFFHNTVHHLKLVNSSEAKRILPLCTGVENLSLYQSADRWIPLIERFRLRRLYTDFKCLPPATHPMFSRLTHFHLCGDPEDMESACYIISALPKLTHLSLDGDDLVFKSPRILESSRSLRVLVFFEYYATEWTIAEVTELTRDERFVVMQSASIYDYDEDWYAGVQHGTDYWRLAEAFVTKRRAGEIDRASII